MSKLLPAGSPAPENDSQDLLAWLQLQHSDAYRKIRFYVPSKHGEFQTRSKRNYSKRTSFDTINLSYDVDDDDQHDEELFGRYEFADRGRERNRYLSPSPPHSPPRRMRSPLGMDAPMDSSVFQLAPRTDFPTRPIITHRGCTYTKIHCEWEKLYKGKLDIAPVLRHRTILVYISGRQHTWVALDWILAKYIENGDSVVIVASVPPEFPVRRRLTFRSPTPPANSAAPAVRMRQRHRPEYVKVIAKNVMSYAMQVVNPEIIAKVSVELALGSTKEVLKDMYRLYEPNLVATGAKVNLKSSAPLRLWNSSRLSDRLVKNFPLPVIVVPAINMNGFESTLEARVNSAETGPCDEPLIGDDATDSGSINSEGSSSSLNSDESYSSYDEISKIYGEYRLDIRRSINRLKKSERGDGFFASFLTMISDKSLDFCTEVREINPHFSGRGAKLARAITGSNAFGMLPYKTKSLLEPEVKQTKTQQSLSYKEMMKNLKENKLAPLITTEDSDSTPSPRSPTLKFVDPEPPRRDKAAKALAKSLSHDVTDGNARPKLEPLKSHPDLHAVSSGARSPDPNQADKKKRRRSKLWGLFK